MFTVLSTLVITLLCVKIFQWRSYWSKRGVKHGSLWQDFLGVFIRRESFCEALIRAYTSFPKSRLVGLSQTLIPDLVFTDVDLIKQISVKDFEHFTDHRWFIPDGLDPLWSKNLFALKGLEWKHMRTTLSPCFTSSKMKMIFNSITECSQNHLEYYLNNKKIKTVEVTDIFTRYTADVIASVAFSIKSDSTKDKTNDFYVMGEKSTSFDFVTRLVLLICTLMPGVSKILGLKYLDKTTGKLFRKTVTNSIKIREENGIIRPDMLYMLLEARKGRVKDEDNQIKDNEFAVVKEMLKSDLIKKPYITENDMAAQAVIFFFAGFHTVSVLLSFMAYELALNPDIQRKLQEEIDTMLEKCEGKLTYEAIVHMKYMDMVVSETLRKWPPVVGIDRTCTEAYTFDSIDEEGRCLTVYPGEVIWIPVGAIHRDPKYYLNPDKFDPERFNEENKSKIKPYSFLSFGLGPRNCIGSRLALLEVKTVFFYILSKFKFVPNKKTETNLKLKKASFNLLEAKEIWVDLKLRE